MEIHNDDRLTIVNRSLIYNVSKKLMCSSVPYFEKMFCCDLLESKENKVMLDFDEHAFNAILNWIHTGLFTIKMDSVINFYEASDYLMINESLLEPCRSFFRENFTIEHIPAVLSQVTKVSKLIDSGSIESFICRHFLKIVNTDVFLNYPVETVETILRLNLMVHSENQIFESIMKWVNKSVDSRKDSLPRLLGCVRWSYMNYINISTIKSIDHADYSNRESGFNRSNQCFFVSIHINRDLNSLRKNSLRIRVFDNEFLCLPIGDFTQDDSISLELVHGEHISDILFDSGRTGVRIDWTSKTFRWLHPTGDSNTYYYQIYQSVIKFLTEPKYLDCYLMDKETELPQKVPGGECMLIESGDQFILIGIAKGRFFGIFEVARCWFTTDYSKKRYSFKATVLNNNVYILTRNIEFIQFNLDTRTFKKSQPFKEKELLFDQLFIASHQANDKIILVDRFTGKIYSFNVTNENWSEMCQIVNLNFGLTNEDFYEFTAFTSTFLPMKFIKFQFD